MKQSLYSPNKLAALLHCDRQTINRLIRDQNIEPVKADGRAKLYHLEDIQNAFSNKPNKTLKEEKLQEEIRKLRINNDSKDRLLVSRQAVENSIQRTNTREAHLLEQKLVREWPSKVAGLSVQEAMIYGKKLFDEIQLERQKFAEEWKI